MARRLKAFRCPVCEEVMYDGSGIYEDEMYETEDGEILCADCLCKFVAAHYEAAELAEALGLRIIPIMDVAGEYNDPDY